MNICWSTLVKSDLHLINLLFGFWWSLSTCDGSRTCFWFFGCMMHSQIASKRYPWQFSSSSSWYPFWDIVSLGLNGNPAALLFTTYKGHVVIHHLSAFESSWIIVPLYSHLHVHKYIHIIPILSIVFPWFRQFFVLRQAFIDFIETSTQQAVSTKNETSGAPQCLRASIRGSSGSASTQKNGGI